MVLAGLAIVRSATVVGAQITYLHTWSLPRNTPYEFYIWKTAASELVLCAFAVWALGVAVRILRGRAGYASQFLLTAALLTGWILVMLDELAGVGPMQWMTTTFFEEYSYEQLFTVWASNIYNGLLWIVPAVAILLTLTLPEVRHGIDHRDGPVHPSRHRRLVVNFIILALLTTLLFALIGPSAPTALGITTKVPMRGALPPWDAIYVFMTIGAMLALASLLTRAQWARKFTGIAAATLAASILIVQGLYMSKTLLATSNPSGLPLPLLILGNGITTLGQLVIPALMAGLAWAQAEPAGGPPTEEGVATLQT